jgi:hypothetical protein
MERSLSNASRRGAGFLSLALFLLACLGPHLPFLHADHHGAEAHAAGIPVEAGDRVLSEAQDGIHECFLCLWKSHRDGQAWEGAQPAAQPFLAAPAAVFHDAEGAAPRALLASAPARAPPALA